MALHYAKLDNVLWSWAANSTLIEDFTVSNVLHAANLESQYYELVLKYLLSKQSFWLNAYLILLCPNNHKGERIPLDFHVDPEEEFDCWCGNDYSYNPDHSLLAFSFTEEFREEAVLEKKKIHL